MDKSVYRYSIAREKVAEMQEGFGAGTPEKVAAFLRSIGLAEEEQEHLVALALNVRNIVTGYYTVSIGTAEYSVCGYRELVRQAVILNASGIILGHNHPSGFCEPSAEDMRLTRDARTAGDAVGIKVLDHVIVGGTGYYSFVENKLI